MYAAFGLASPFTPALLHERGLNVAFVGLFLGLGTAIAFSLWIFWQSSEGNPEEKKEKSKPPASPYLNVDLAVKYVGDRACAKCHADVTAHWYEAVLMFDGDAAGRSCTDQSLVKLGRSMWVRAALVGEGKQPDQLSPDDMHNLMSSYL